MHWQVRLFQVTGVTVKIEENRLERAGYEYNAVQRRVNELL